MRKRVVVLCFFVFVMMMSVSYAYTNKQEKWFKMMEDVYVDSGMGIDQDNIMGAQCVDVASNYASYIFPIHNDKFDYTLTLNFGNGKELYDNAYAEYFYKIPYGKGVVPKRGDIVVWGGPTTLWGHVGVVADADENKMTVIHQNVGYQDGVIKTEEGYGYHSFSGSVIGFLRPKDEMIKKLNPGSDGNPHYNLDTKVLSRGSDLIRPDELKKIEREKYSKGYNACIDLGLMKESSGVSATTAFTRLQGIVLTLRVAGLEAEAKALTKTGVEAVLSSLSDHKSMPHWGKNYAAFAMEEGIIKGITVRGGSPQFRPDQALTGRSFTTILLRALGYRDATFKTIREDFAALVGGQDESLAFVTDEALSRDRAGAILYSAIKNLNYVRQDKPLYEFLIDENLIDGELFEKLIF